MEYKHFKCYKCYFHNNFYIPIEIKGKKCKRCHTFNYFIFFKNKKKNKNNNIKNNNIKNRTRKDNIYLKSTISSKNTLGTFDNHNINREIHFSPYNNDNDYINNYDEEPFNFQFSNNLNNFGLSNDILVFPQFRFINNNPNFQNNNGNLFHNFNNLNNNNNNYNYGNGGLNNNNSNIPWLKKEKLAKEIIEKYGENYKCSICLENIKDDIHITKCDHIFHYKCIEEAINKNIMNCPNCRCNLRTGEKQRINNNRNIFNININRDTNNNNIFRNIFNNIEYNVNRDINNNNIERREINSERIEENNIYYPYIILFLILTVLLGNIVG